eukprot:6609994-Pyramimonas_sp.AAC.1
MWAADELQSCSTQQPKGIIRSASLKYPDARTRSATRVEATELLIFCEFSKMVMPFLRQLELQMS